jgi:ankyrin repeat protein
MQTISLGKIGGNLTGWVEKMEKVKKSGDDRTLLHRAAAVRDLISVKSLLFHGADVSARDAKMRTPLHCAAASSTEAVQLLLNKGADPNAIDSRGRTPLHYSVASRQLDIVRILLHFGADAHIRDSDGWLPVRYAENEQDHDMIELLMGFRSTAPGSRKSMDQPFASKSDKGSGR